MSVEEAETYRSAGAGRWFSDARDPFEPIEGYPGLLQIRKQADGACGFLGANGLCRLHEELGFEGKPIACRVFPFRFHPIDGDVVVTTSFSCPTVVANEGAPLPAQARDLNTLFAAWTRAQPEAPARVELEAGRAMPAAILPKLRSVLVRILDTPAPDGSLDLAVSVRRLGAFVDDLSRRRVLRLSDDDLDQYFDVMSRHALAFDRVAPARPPSRLARLLFRGFLLAALSVRLHLKKTRSIRPALIRLALHVHGLAPGTDDFDLRRIRGVGLDIADDEIRETATHYLRSTLGTIGTGRRPAIDEIGMAVAHLNAACVFARMHAARLNYRSVDVSAFRQGLLESADLALADDGGRLSRFLTMFSGGIEGLYLFPASTI